MRAGAVVGSACAIIHFSLFSESNVTSCLLHMTV